jgi:hypothetical protein
MDLLFDGLDQLMEAARRRFPVAVAAVALVLWGVLAAGSGYLLVTEGLAIGAALVSAGPVVLLLWTGACGIGRIPRPVWRICAGTLVVVGGLILPQLSPPSPTYRLALAVASFVYVQVFLGLLVSVDELTRTRVRRRSDRDDRPEPTQRGHRRVLQLRVLLATLLVAVLTDLGEPRDYAERTADPGGGPPFLLKAAILLVLVLAFVGVFRRGRILAATVAAGLLAAFALDAYLLDPGARTTLITQHGWLVLSTSYLWGRAATRPYWPSELEPPTSPDAHGWTPPPQWGREPTP